MVPTAAGCQHFKQIQRCFLLRHRGVIIYRLHTFPSASLIEVDSDFSERHSVLQSLVAVGSLARDSERHSGHRQRRRTWCLIAARTAQSSTRCNALLGASSTCVAAESPQRRSRRRRQLRDAFVKPMANERRTTYDTPQWVSSSVPGRAEK